jgi:quercetin dioxygenase-like cupin family protein
MTFLHLNDLEEKEPVPGFRARFVHTDHMTLAYWDVDDGAEVPDHSHPHEQVVSVLEGDLELNVGGTLKRMGPGSVAIVPPNTPHSGKALSKARIIDVFHPARDDYR